MIGQERLFDAAVRAWGRDSQIDMAFEEMAELMKALCKLKRSGGNSRDAIEAVAEEVADVDLMLRQLERMLDLTETEQRKTAKLHRLEGLLIEAGELGA